MDTISISDARAFSLQGPQRSRLIAAEDLEAELLCFEAGQKDDARSFGGSSAYQVLEGEARIRQGGESARLGKGKLVSVPARAEHVVENAGGGLLVVLAVRAR